LSTNITPLNATNWPAIHEAKWTTIINTFDSTICTTYDETIWATFIAANDETIRSTFVTTIYGAFLPTNRTTYWSTFIEPYTTIKPTFNTTKFSAVEEPYITTNNEALFTAILPAVDGTIRTTLFFTIWSTNIKSYTTVFNTNNCSNYNSNNGSAGCSHIHSYKSSHESIITTDHAAYNATFI
jgi:hypothetical protein